MDRIFISGASGLLGSNIINTFSKNYKLYGSYNKNKVNFDKHSIIKIDLTNIDEINAIKKINPDLIIHCASLVNIDECEKHPDIAYTQNVIATRNIVNIAQNTNSFLIYISTDAVFDGKKGNYTESDETNPINIYGKTKLEAEKVVEKSNLDYCIARTNIYGWNKRNKFSLAEWMINKFELKEELPAFKDIIITPILVNNLSRALDEIYKKQIKGILHLSSSDSCSKLDFAKKIAKIFSYNQDLIKPISIKDIGLEAIRGKNLSLNTKKAQHDLNTKLLDIDEGLKEMKRLKDDGYLNDFKEI